MKRKRFKSRDEILAFIFKWNSRRNQLLREADEDDAVADGYRGFRGMGNDISYRRKEAQRKRGLALKYENTKIPRLKRTLAAWDTPSLPGIDAGESLLLEVE